jgi:hypothetical protein
MHAAPAVSVLLQPRFTCPWVVWARMEAWRVPTSGLRTQGLHSSSSSSRQTVHGMLLPACCLPGRAGMNVDEQGPLQHPALNCHQSDENATRASSAGPALS